MIDFLALTLYVDRNLPPNDQHKLTVSLHLDLRGHFPQHPEQRVSATYQRSSSQNLADYSTRERLKDCGH